jgi:hypothetical protein
MPSVRALLLDRPLFFEFEPRFLLYGKLFGMLSVTTGDPRFQPVPDGRQSPATDSLRYTAARFRLEEG